MRFGLRLHPITRKRLRRFRTLKRGYWSFWTLCLLYLVSLSAELLCNNVPLYVRCRGKSYFPVFRFYPDDTFTGSGRLTRPDYKAINDSSDFRREPGNRMLFPPIPFGPYEVVEPDDIQVPDHITLELRPEPRLASIDIDSDFRIVRETGAAAFFPDRSGLPGLLLTEHWRLPPTIQSAVAQRFANRNAARVTATEAAHDGSDRAEFYLAPFTARQRPPATVRLSLREPGDGLEDTIVLTFAGDGRVLRDPTGTWPRIAEPGRALLLELVRQAFAESADEKPLTVGGVRYRARASREQIHFPFRPVAGHWLGLDGAGRDVLARVLYGLRTSMSFGLILVSCALCFGTLMGAVQGYFGGWIDITGQRLIEIWSALPFLYIMILMGSVYGRSFGILVVCYGLFNWIGMSYYMRAELLRLRRQPFVEAARCLGLPTWKIVFRHVLPNALVPLITLFPFSLVGAIGALAALDYLGFGLPPPTPSWGELLHQAQTYRWAWWLILYPSLALFAVILLGVFVGEGVRNAFDPRKYARLV